MSAPLDRSNRFLTGKPVSFDEAFPTLQDATIEYFEVGKGGGVQYISGRDNPSSYRYGLPCSLQTLNGLLRCCNPFCYRGGYEIDFDVSGMVRRKLIEKEFVGRCPGDEGSPKGRRPGRKCLNALHYKITLQYKFDHQPERWKRRTELSVVNVRRCPICRSPLIPEQHRSGRTSCGLHVFKDSGKEENLILESRTDRGSWPREGEQIQAGKLTIQCLELNEETAKSLTAGRADAETHARAVACATDNIPILSRAVGGFNQVIFENGVFRILPLTGDRARSFL